MPFPQYDEVHVVSDLHMGGENDFQILRETEKLAAFIRWVAQQQPDGRVALVLNGDIIDTLAEKNVHYIAVDDAEAVIGRIMEDPEFYGSGKPWRITRNGRTAPWSWYSATTTWNSPSPWSSAPF